MFLLHDAMQQLTDFPALGQRCDHLGPSLRRKNVERHTIYYRISGPDIYVLDILHQSMLPERHLTKDEQN